MSAAHDVEFSLAPQWLKGHGHGLHSPAGPGGTSTGRPGTQRLGASSGGRRLTVDNLLEHSKQQASGDVNETEHHTDFSPLRSIAHSSRPLSDSHAASKASLRDTYHQSSRISTGLPSPSSNGFHRATDHRATNSWLTRHAGEGPMSFRPGGATNSQHVSGRTRLQRTSSEGHGTARSTVSRKLTLDQHEFPQLGIDAVSSPGSDRRHDSPQSYTPSVAPYKQEFLAVRNVAGWTSKLAVAPDATDVSASSNNSSSQASAVGTQEALPASGTVPAAEADALGSSAVSTAPSATPAVVSPTAPSLAQTLKQAVAAADGGVAARSSAKQSTQMLVPLMPGSKAKRGAGTKGTVAAGPVNRAAKPAAVRGKAAGSVAADTPATVNAQPSLLKLGFNSNNGPSLSASGGRIAVAAASCPSSKADKSSQMLRQQSQVSASGANSHSPTEQRQQVKDRNSFFAVLRRKTSISSESCSCSAGEGASSTQSCTDHAQHADVLVSSIVAGQGAKSAARGLQTACGADGKDDSHVEDQTPADSIVVCGVSGNKDDAGQKMPQHSFPKATEEVDNPSSPRSSVLADSTHANTAAQCSVNSVSANVPVAKEPETNSCEAVKDSSYSEFDQASAPLGKQGTCTQQPQSKQQMPQTEINWDLAAEEEEEAFLRSLGWTDNSDADEEWELTAEEIAAFQASAVVRTAQQCQYAAGISKLLLPGNSHSPACDIDKQTAAQQQWHSSSVRGGLSRKYPALGGDQQQYLVTARDVLNGVLGVPAVDHVRCGALSPVYTQPASYLLSYDSDCSSSSNDED